MLLSDFHSYLSNISEYEYKMKIIVCCTDCHTIEKVHIPLDSEALCVGGWIQGFMGVKQI